MIDWPKLLRQLNVPFVEGGKSTAKNNIYVKCPFCSDADQGHHMGISLTGKGWGCWKNERHRGIRAWKLVQALTGMSASQAMQIVGEENATELVGDHNLSTKIGAMLMTNTDVVDHPIKPIALYFPNEIKPLSDKFAHKPFREYIEKRGYARWEVLLLAKRYGLHCTMAGLFQYRLIIPVFAATGQGLATWTGRSIVPNKEPRYLTLTQDAAIAKKYGLVAARHNIKDCLFNERLLLHPAFGTKKKLLMVGEGPFDAIRMDYPHNQARGTCLFGKTVSDTQLEKLDRAGKNFHKKLVLLDPDADMDSFRMWDKLKDIGFKVGKIGKKWEDPGSMTNAAMMEFIHNQIG